MISYSIEPLLFHRRKDRVFRITLADNQAQEYAVAIRQVLAVNTGRYSVFLFRGIWLRIDDIEDDFPIRSPSN